MDLAQSLLLGTVQEPTESLPVSSSAHLRVVPALFGWDGSGAAFTAVTQIGTEAAVLPHFRGDLRRMGRAWAASLRRPEARTDPDARLARFVLFGPLPIAVLGRLLAPWAETVARDLRVTATMLIVVGLGLLLAEEWGTGQRALSRLAGRHAATLGFAQALTLIPGVPRSGASLLK